MALPTQRAYKLTSREYAEQFNVSKSTVDRWRQMGAPLDQPEKMAAWISVNNSRQKPAGMTFEVVDDEEPQEQGLVKYGDDTSGIEAEIESEEDERFGARVEIEALERECAKSRKLYMKNRTHAVYGPQYLKAWTKLVDVLRALSKDTPKSEESDGKTLPVDDVKESLIAVTKRFKTMVEAMAQNVRMRMSHINEEIQVEYEEQMKDEAANVLTFLEKARWLDTD